MSKIEKNNFYNWRSKYPFNSHRSSTFAKDKLEKEFAFSFLPLKDLSGRPIQDDDYKLIVYKVSDKKCIDAKNYLTLKPIHGTDIEVPRVEGITYTKVRF